MDDKEKIEKLRKYANLTWRALASRLDIKSVQTFQDIRAGRINISSPLRQRILAEFPDINPGWLNGDDENMLVKKSESDIKSEYFPSADERMLYNGSGMVEYPKGCIIMLHRVTSHTLVVSGNIYNVETADFSEVRQVMKMDDDRYRLVASDKTEYDGSLVYGDIVVDRSAIVKMSAVLGYIVPERSC